MTWQEAEELIDKLDKAFRIALVKSIVVGILVMILLFTIASIIEWLPGYLRYKKDLKELKKKGRIDGL